MVNQALQFIDGHAGSPFFLHLALNTPHANNEGGKGNFRRGMEVPDFGPFTDRDWPDEKNSFARMIRDLDLTVKRVVEKLREHELAERIY